MQDFVGDDPDPHVGHVSHLLPQGRICILIKYLAQAILAQAILGGEHDRAQAMEPMREGRPLIVQVEASVALLYTLEE